MAICDWCYQEMSSNTTNTCTGNEFVEFPDGEKLPAIKYTNVGLSRYVGVLDGYTNEKIEDSNQRCHDCNIQVGGYHHPGCDMEECPRCHGQLISCGCLDDEEEEEEEEEE